MACPAKVPDWALFAHTHRACSPGHPVTIPHDKRGLLAPCGQSPGASVEEPARVIAALLPAPAVSSRDDRTPRLIAAPASRVACATPFMTEEKQ